MQLRIFITLFLISLSSLTFSQQKTDKSTLILVNTEAFSTIQDKVFASYLLLDSISASKIDDKGVVYFKFNLEKGKVKNLKYTSSAPNFIINCIETYLYSIDNVLLNANLIDENEFLILPIEYDYRKGNQAKNFGELLKKLPIPVINAEKIGFENFNQLFDLNIQKMYGLKCIILTPIRINKPIA